MPLLITHMLTTLSSSSLSIFKAKLHLQKHTGEQCNLLALLKWCCKKDIDIAQQTVFCLKKNLNTICVVHQYMFLVDKNVSLKKEKNVFKINLFFCPHFFVITVFLTHLIVFKKSSTY